jgi:hypothetical protein
MPFTFAHPAVILPFGRPRFGLSQTGLIAGSMVPDFEFFFLMRVDENIGHHVLGFFVFDIPVAVLLCYLYHGIIRNTFVYNLPGWYYKRLAYTQHFGWHQYAMANKFVLLFSVTIGAASHLLLDAFTHYDGFFVELWPVLSANCFVMGHAFPIYAVLQVAGSVVGLYLVHRYIAAMPINETVDNRVQKKRVYWSGLIFLAAIILTARVRLVPAYQTFWDMLFSTIGSCLYAWLLVSILYSRRSVVVKQE